MAIRFATLAGVTAVTIAATIKDINADQHLPLTNSGAVDSTEAPGSGPRQACGCTHGAQYLTPGQELAPRSAANLELEWKKLRQAIVGAQAQWQQTDKERRRLENELNAVKRQLAAAQQLQAQKDAQTADLKRAGNRDADRPDQNQNARITATTRGNQIWRGGPRGADGAHRAKPTGAAMLFGKPTPADCIRAVRPRYRYGPYETMPPWE